MKIFDQYAEYYNLFYENKHYSKEVAYLCQLIEEFRPGSRSLLELGCGSGKHAAYFADNGYDIFGVDQSPEMISQAQSLKNTLDPELHDRLAFEVADITKLEFGGSSGRTWDVALSLFHVVSYLTTNEKLLAMLNCVRDHLKPDGLFIFDCWYGPGVLTTLPESRQKHLENDLISVVRTAEPIMEIDKNQVNVNYEIEITNKSDGEKQRIEEVHSMRYLFEPEIALMLELSGFKLCECHEWESRKPAGLDSWYATFIAEKQ